MGRKILIVDDSKTVRQTAAKALKAFDCEVLEGSNGIEGLALASRERPDLILLDFTMPIMDGYEMLSKLKSDPDLRTIPVVMLTETAREQASSGEKLGVRGQLAKPFKEEVLVGQVSRVIDLKPRGGIVPKSKSYSDPIQILVVDDKPAIAEQIRAGLRDTQWVVSGAYSPAEALESCGRVMPDVILASLTLADQGGYTLFQSLRGDPKTRGLPVFGLTVKTDVHQQTRAQQSGFTGVITKPIETDELKTRICRILSLDTSERYFLQKDGAMVLTLPSDFSHAVASEAEAHLRIKITAAVDAGLDKMVLDFSQINKADVSLIKFGLTSIQLCKELSLRYCVIGSETVCKECKKYEETKDWRLATSYSDALAQLGVKLQAAA